MFAKRILICLPILLIGSACQSDLLMPKGYIASELRDVLLITTLMIFLIVGPVMVATVIFARKYRAGQNTENYDKSFHHSSQLELLIWVAPLLIIIWLGALTWVSTHKLDPYRPLTSEATGVTEGDPTLTVQVVSMDWKWLFIYPDYGIAVVNEAAAPVNQPIRFDMTSTEVMNAFYVPSLAGMIYTMPSMQTELNAVINAEGDYPGRSSHYSGAGFSEMKFTFHGLAEDGFKAWVDKVRSEGKPLDRAAYLDLEKPSIADPVRYYTLADESLYHDILNRCVRPDQVCIDQQMMHKDHGQDHSQDQAQGQSTNASGDAGHDTGNSANKVALRQE